MESIKFRGASSRALPPPPPRQCRGHQQNNRHARPQNRGSPPCRCQQQRTWENRRNTRRKCQQPPTQRRREQQSAGPEQGERHHPKQQSIHGERHPSGRHQRTRANGTLRQKQKAGRRKNPGRKMAIDLAHVSTDHNTALDISRKKKGVFFWEIGGRVLAL